METVELFECLKNNQWIHSSYTLQFADRPCMKVAPGWLFWRDGFIRTDESWPELFCYMAVFGSCAAIGKFVPVLN